MSDSGGLDVIGAPPLPDVPIARFALPSVHRQVGERIAVGIGYDPIERIQLRQKYAPVPDLLHGMRGPDLAILLRFLLAGSNRARLAVDAVIGLLPLMDPIAHRIGILEAFLSQPQSGDDDDVLVDE